ncbi:serine/threonine protein kinase, partial [Pyxidicoccus sp. 3LG]
EVQVQDPAEAPEDEAPASDADAKGTRTKPTAPGRKGKDGKVGSSPANWAAGSQPTGAEAGSRTAKRPAPKADEPATEPVTTVTQNPEGMGEVLDTSTPKGAAKAGLGWITLFTVPRAAVFDGATSLGTTPLQKFPLPVGTYRLRVVDPTDAESASRLLSAPIRPGEVTKLQIRLADLPLYKE